MPTAQRFIMTLARNDVSGQRGEGYMLVPKGARDKNPGFWGWPGKYSKTTDPERRVVVLDGAAQDDQRIYWFAGKSEFRLCTNLYFAGASENAILLVEKDPSAGIDFRYTLIEPSEPEYADLKRLAKDWATSGSKRFGFV